MLLDKYKNYKYAFFPSKRESYDSTKPILTIIHDAYFNLSLVMQAIESILNQTYQNVELMLIDNGALEEVSSYLRKIYEEKKNVSLVKFDRNVFDWKDPCVSVSVCWNIGLFYCKGDYVSHLSYDDLLSKNYAEKMVSLFLENPNCVTAAPSVVSIDISGNIKGNNLDTNRRKRFSDGFVLALDLLNGNEKKLFSAPGEVLVIRKDLLLKEGGFDRIVDISQLLKYAIFGESGYDPDAQVFWRSHAGQTNKLSKAKGEIFYRSLIKGWEESRILEIWESRYDREILSRVKKFKDHQISSTVYTVVSENTANYKLWPVILSLKNVLCDCPQFFLQSCWIVFLGIFNLPFLILRKIFRKLRMSF
ncbi:glycosyltransferase family A protein [Leptospira borgpetersenii]|uniref:Glycosyltransferase-like protein, family 2 n=1 Tax=Leptospira borgpetersenii serovar Javanica str. UI 09931 TaxID=1049767 RepID=A0AAV3J633_LEPBO|nr:glycosyltransferase family A protein [Leptospira borgpetersenii]AXX16251.1 glycosyltransferase family 2 protein [Leptospira borgpetersenii serovar Ceylonica]EKQ90021.1 glycosyltransferase-like protein, family 2 [Leptospira borgpetersenii str. UI 09149]EMN58561.1 glycosyltransferase-like protein, family 2 [Leptospira borgpetersenii serovar Javanica str. MK146]EPG56228.1 glycosyltransferase-like protein, family 2 [Leptospira borgpetersenii serovar Javanica str. UI 09931]MDQ7244343.1 glycosylt